MWAQLIKARVSPERESEVEQLQREFEARAQDGSTGWVRSITLRNQNDPQEFYSLVFFESEEKARENERNPQQAEMAQKLVSIFEGPPEFVDMIPVYESSR